MYKGTAGRVGVAVLFAAAAAALPWVWVAARSCFAVEATSMMGLTSYAFVTAYVVAVLIGLRATIIAYWPDRSISGVLSRTLPEWLDSQTGWRGLILLISLGISLVFPGYSLFRDVGHVDTCLGSDTGGVLFVLMGGIAAAGLLAVDGLTRPRARSPEE